MVCSARYGRPGEFALAGRHTEAAARTHPGAATKRLAQPRPFRDRTDCTRTFLLYDDIALRSSVFSGVGEESESKAAYSRDIEIKRRVYLLQKDLLNAQIDAVATQKAATTEAVKQSTFMLYSTISVFLTALITLATAYFHK